MAQAVRRRHGTDEVAEWANGSARNGGNDFSRRVRMLNPFYRLTLGLLLAVAISPAPSAAHNGKPLRGYGTATVDGVIAPGEWDRAARLDYAANLPPNDGGGTVPSS